MAEKKLNLLADFPAITTEEWMAKINADLKGADFEKKLVWKTNEGFNVMPFYRLEDVAELKTTTSAPMITVFYSTKTTLLCMLIPEDVQAAIPFPLLSPKWLTMPSKVLPA